MISVGSIVDNCFHALLSFHFHLMTYYVCISEFIYIQCMDIIVHVPTIRCLHKDKLLLNIYHALWALV